MNNVPVMLKIREIPAHFPGVTEHMARQLVINGEIPSVRVGKKYLIAESVLCEYLIKGNNQAEQPQSKIRRLG